MPLPNTLTQKKLQAQELIGHYVAYRKLVSRSPSDLLPEDEFGLYAVTARYPAHLSNQVPWVQVLPGVYDYRWGTDTVRVVVAGELSREPHNAPLHLFSARPDLIEFGGQRYGYHSARTSRLMEQLFKDLHAEDIAMPYTMEDFDRQYTLDRFGRLTTEEQQEALQKLTPKMRQKLLRTLPPEERLAGLSAELIRQYLDEVSRSRPAAARKPRRKK